MILKKWNVYFEANREVTKRSKSLGDFTWTPYDVLEEGDPGRNRRKNR